MPTSEENLNKSEQPVEVEAEIGNIVNRVCELKAKGIEFAEEVESQWKSLAGLISQLNYELKLYNQDPSGHKDLVDIKWLESLKQDVLDEMEKLKPILQELDDKLAKTPEVELSASSQEKASQIESTKTEQLGLITEVTKAIQDREANKVRTLISLKVITKIEDLLKKSKTSLSDAEKTELRELELLQNAANSFLENVDEFATQKKDGEAELEQNLPDASEDQSVTEPVISTSESENNDPDFIIEAEIREISNLIDYLLAEKDISLNEDTDRQWNELHERYSDFSRELQEYKKNSQVYEEKHGVEHLGLLRGEVREGIDKLVPIILKLGQESPVDEPLEQSQNVPNSFTDALRLSLAKDKTQAELAQADKAMEKLDGHIDELLSFVFEKIKNDDRFNRKELDKLVETIVTESQLPESVVRRVYALLNQQFDEMARQQVQSEKTLGKVAKQAGVKAGIYGGLAIASGVAFTPLGTAAILGVTRIADVIRTTVKEKNQINKKKKEIADNAQNYDVTNIKDQIKAAVVGLLSSEKQKEIMSGSALFTEDEKKQLEKLKVRVNKAKNYEQADDLRREYQQALETLQIFQNEGAFEAHVRLKLGQDNLPENSEELNEHLGILKSLYLNEQINAFEDIMVSTRFGFDKKGKESGFDKKLKTAGTLTVLGTMARVIPGVREAMFAYGGAKAGEGIHQYLSQRADRLANLDEPEVSEDRGAKPKVKFMDRLAKRVGGSEFKINKKLKEVERVVSNLDQNLPLIWEELEVALGFARSLLVTREVRYNAKLRLSLESSISKIEEDFALLGIKDLKISLEKAFNKRHDETEEYADSNRRKKRQQTIFKAAGSAIGVVAGDSLTTLVPEVLGMISGRDIKGHNIISDLAEMKGKGVGATLGDRWDQFAGTGETKPAGVIENQAQPEGGLKQELPVKELTQTELSELSQSERDDYEAFKWLAEDLNFRPGQNWYGYKPDGAYIIKNFPEDYTGSINVIYFDSQGSQQEIKVDISWLKDQIKQTADTNGTIMLKQIPDVDQFIAEHKAELKDIDLAYKKFDQISNISSTEPGGQTTGPSESIEGPGVVAEDVAIVNLRENSAFAPQVPEAGIIVKSGTVINGGSVSQALGIAKMPGYMEAKVTVINPDGTRLEDFDANLVHEGDTVVETKAGEILVYKTSETAVTPDMSLEVRYDEIAEQFKLDQIPQSLRDAFNTDKGKGGFFTSLNYSEAQAVREFWDSYRTEIEQLSPENQQQFYNTITNPEDADSVLENLLNEQDKSAALEQQRIINEAKVAENSTIQEYITSNSQTMELADGDKVLALDTDNNGVFDTIGFSTKDGTVYYTSQPDSEMNSEDITTAMEQGKVASENLDKFADKISYKGLGFLSRNINVSRSETAQFYNALQEANGHNLTNLEEFANNDIKALDNFVDHIGRKNFDLLKINGEYSVPKFKLASEVVKLDWSNGNVRQALRIADSQEQVRIANSLLARSQSLDPVNFFRALNVTSNTENLDLEHDLVLAELTAKRTHGGDVEIVPKEISRLFGGLVKAESASFADSGTEKLVFEGVISTKGSLEHTVTLDIENNRIIISREGKTVQDLALTNHQLDNISNYLQDQPVEAEPITAPKVDAPVETDE